MFYLIITVVLFIIETLIAVFVHDKFVRPYLGDVLVVVLVYTFVRTIILDKTKLLPLWVFVFAVFVEVTQYFNLIGILGLQDNSLAKAVLGSSFDLKDILCYAVGCLILGIYEFNSEKILKMLGDCT